MRKMAKGPLAISVISLICLLVYTRMRSRFSHTLSLESETTHSLPMLSSQTDYDVYRNAYRNDMEAEKAAQITEYNLYKQHFRVNMQSGSAPVSGLRAPEAVLVASVIWPAHFHLWFKLPNILHHVLFSDHSKLLSIKFLSHLVVVLDQRPCIWQSRSVLLQVHPRDSRTRMQSLAMVMLVWIWLGNILES